MMTELSASVDQLSYEQAFAEIETIVAQMESDALTLENAISLYERGKALVARCGELLERAELKVKQLSDTTDETFPISDDVENDLSGEEE